MTQTYDEYEHRKKWFKDEENGHEYEIIKHIGRERVIVWDDEYFNYAIGCLEDSVIYMNIDQQLFMELMDMDPPHIFDSLRNNSGTFMDDPNDEH